MDYGKVAYMRTEDFAKRIAGLEREQSNAYGMTLISSKASAPLAGGKTYHHILSSSNHAACQIIFHVKVSGTSGGTLGLDMKIADVKVLHEEVNFDAGERDAFFAVGASFVRGTQEATVTMTGEFTLISYDLMIFGGGIMTAVSEVHLSVGLSHVLVATEGMAKIYNFNDLSAPILTVMCDIASIYTSNSLDYVVFVDHGIAFASPVVDFRAHCVARGVTDCAGLGEERFAVVANGIAYSQNGYALTRIPSPSSRVLGLSAVTDSPVPAIVMRLAGGRLFYKSAYSGMTIGSLVMGGSV